MIFWNQIYKMYLTTAIDPGTANSIAMGILILPMFALEFIIQHITARYPYIRATVRPHNKTLRIFIKSHEEIRGDGYSVRRIETNWPVNSEYYGPVNHLNIIYEGKWSDRIHYRNGRARHMEYEVNHGLVEQVILYELMEGVLDLDHSDEIPNYLLVNASGDYHDEMFLVGDYSAKDKKEEVLPSELIEEKGPLAQTRGTEEPETPPTEEEKEPKEETEPPLSLEGNEIIFNEEGEEPQ